MTQDDSSHIANRDAAPERAKEQTDTRENPAWTKMRVLRQDSLRKAQFSRLFTRKWGYFPLAVLNGAAKLAFLSMSVLLIFQERAEARSRDKGAEGSGDRDRKCEPHPIP